MAVDKTKDIQVGGTLHSIATGNIIAHADEVMDEDYGKKQSVINQELSNRLTEELKGYLPLTGGTMNGNITFPNTLGILIQDKTNTDLLNAAGSTTTIASILDQVPKNVSAFNNDAKYQTEEQVAAKVASLVDSAPETLDTLNELAAALGDDPNFATTVTNLIGTKVDNSKWETIANIVTTISDFSYAEDSIQLNHKFILKNDNGSFSSENTAGKKINAATSTTAGVLTAEDFKKLSNITLGENGGISGINFNAGPSDAATFAIETEVNDDATTFVFRLTDNIPVQDKIQFRTSEWYNGGVNHYTPVQITDILESRNPTTNKLERVANISELPSVVTTSADGLMSAADKTKLDGIDLSNYVNKSGDTISGNLYFSSPIDDRKLCINGNMISVITPTDKDSWATAYFIVKDQEETKLAIGMGAFGQQNIVKYFYLGGEYNYAVMYVDPNGRRVGIGTSTPSEKLEVSGNVKAEGFIIPDGTANEVLTADGSAISINNLVGSATLLGFTESTESNENLEIEATDTINQGFGKLQKAIKDNELVIAEALNSIKDNLGAEDLNAALPDLSTTHYLGSATTFIDCLKALDTKLYEIEQALTLKTV